MNAIKGSTFFAHVLWKVGHGLADLMTRIIVSGFLAHKYAACVTYIHTYIYIYI